MDLIPIKPEAPPSEQLHGALVSARVSSASLRNGRPEAVGRPPLEEALDFCERLMAASPKLHHPYAEVYLGIASHAFKYARRSIAEKNWDQAYRIFDMIHNFGMLLEPHNTWSDSRFLDGFATPYLNHSPQAYSSDLRPLFARLRPVPEESSDMIAAYRRLAQTLGSILEEIENEIRPGRTTKDLEQVAADAILRAGLRSCFKGYRGYPAHITASLNDEILNTPPSTRSMTDGDLLKLQVGICEEAAFSYQAWTYFVGPPSKEDRRFVDSGRKALARAMAEIGAGRAVGLVSKAIQETLEGAGYSVNREYVGHGMGARQHEPPMIPCFVMPGTEPPDLLEDGRILSVQVIAHRGRSKCRVIRDGWSVVTADGSRALLLSGIVVVRPERAEILLGPRNSGP